MNAAPQTSEPPLRIHIQIDLQPRLGYEETVPEHSVFWTKASAEKPLVFADANQTGAFVL